jgi:twitching motility protein PilT
MIADGEYHGMQTFDQSLAGLVRAGTITLDTALAAASNPHDLKVALQNGAGSRLMMPPQDEVAAS